MSRVAVIIPFHNDAGLVTEALASVRETEPVEIVVVDDGSDDRASLDELDRLRAQGTRVVSQENAGPAAARNAGVAATSAPFVLSLDADDVLEKGILGELADALETRADAAFAWGDYVEFGAHEGRYRAPDRFLPWSLQYVNLYPPCALFRRDALLAAGGWPAGIGYEDWGLWLGLAEQGFDGVAVPRIVYRRRIHDSARGLTRDRQRHGQVYRELRARYPRVFSNRRALAALERPPRWKRIAYPVVFGRRIALPAGLENRLRRTWLWTKLRHLRR